MLDEFIGLAYARRGLPVVCFRLSTPSARVRAASTGWSSLASSDAALAASRSQVHGDESQSRCFLHVRDAVSAIMKLERAPQAVGEVFNIGSTESVTILELAEQVIETVGTRNGRASSLGSSLNGNGNGRRLGPHRARPVPRGVPERRLRGHPRTAALGRQAARGDALARPPRSRRHPAGRRRSEVEGGRARDRRGGCQRGGAPRLPEARSPAAAARPAPARLGGAGATMAHVNKRPTRPGTGRVTSSPRRALHGGRRRAPRRSARRRAALGARPPSGSPHRDDVAVADHREGRRERRGGNVRRRPLDARPGQSTAV